MSNEHNKKDIAIIGMSGVFPGSSNIPQLWNNLMASKEAIHFYKKDELKKQGVIAKDQPNTVFASALIDDAESFDNAFFGFDTEEAFYMDPQIRKFFEHTWSAFEDAGYDLSVLKERVGVFTAASDNLNWRAFSNFAKSKNINPFYLNQISNKNYLSTLLSYKLNFRGPSYYINTACSSSLTAVHIACRNLLLRECAIAVAGGVRITTTKELGYTYQEGMIHSKDGHCRAFDKDASGAVFGEGVGVVVLKRLSDSIRDHDNIHAIIKASSTNNDGANKVGFTAPSVQGQFDCIVQAQKVAAVDSNTISFIEAHGTGTKLGDSIEIQALNKAFDHKESKHCAIGSIKSNLGHLDAASGITGLIKAALTVKNRVLPASLHYNEPSKTTNFHEGPFYVNTEAKDFPSDKLLIGGVSSFGMGGTNAHVIVQEPPKSTNTNKNSVYEILPFSAKTKNALDVYRRDINLFLESDTSTAIQSNICYTYATGRAQFDYRSCLLLKDGFVEKSFDSISDEFNNKGKGLVFVFSGQGSQHINMGRHLYNNEPYFKAIMDRGFEILDKKSDENMFDILFNDASLARGRINETVFAQPLLFLVEYALATTLMHWGVSPDVMIGHSLGEYVVACISRVFSFEDALNLMVIRGSLMNQAPKGKMLAIQDAIENQKPKLGYNVEIAVINTHSSFVISGSEKDILDTKKRLDANGTENTLLSTSHAFHSKSMESILDTFSEKVALMKLNKPKIPFVSNITGELITDEMATSSSYWTSHLRNTVRFSDGIDHLIESGFSSFIEIGVGSSLSAMLKQQALRNKSEVQTYSTLKRFKEEDYFKDSLILWLLGSLWCEGAPIDWNLYYENKNHHKISVPTYPFEKNKFPVKVDPLEKYDGDIPTIEHTIQSPVANPKKHARKKKKQLTLPSEPIQLKLASIWKDFFKLDEVGIKEDFFDIGGDSLKAVTMHNRIFEEFNVKLDIQDYYNYTTIEALSKEIGNAQKILALQKKSDETSNSSEKNIKKIKL